MHYKDPLLATNFKSTFLSSEKDQEIIWKKLFIENKPYSDKLKRLLIIDSSNCLDEQQLQYKEIIDSYSIKKLKDEKYLTLTPRFRFNEHENKKSYILLEFDDFEPSDNPQYRSSIISFTIVCHFDNWELDDYKLRPHQIAGYIDGILAGTKLTGIGRLQFIGAAQTTFTENFGGLILQYVGINSDANDAETINPKWPAPQDLGLPQ